MLAGHVRHDDKSNKPELIRADLHIIVPLIAALSRTLIATLIAPCIVSLKEPCCHSSKPITAPSCWDAVFERSRASQGAEDLYTQQDPVTRSWTIEDAVMSVDVTNQKLLDTSHVAKEPIAVGLSVQTTEGFMRCMHCIIGHK